MKPQRPQRNTPGPPKPVVTVSEYSIKDITVKIISCAIEVRSSLGPEQLENL